MAEEVGEGQGYNVGLYVTDYDDDGLSQQGRQAAAGVANIWFQRKQNMEIQF